MELFKLLVIPLLTIFAGGIGWLIKSKYETRKLEREAIQEQRFTAYFDAIEPLIDILALVSANKNKIKNKPSFKDKIDAPSYRRKAFHLLLFADDNVVRAWNKLWYELHHNQADINNIIVHVDNIGELLVQIRKSLGYPNTKVDKRDMFTWFIKDIEGMEALIKKAKSR